MRILVELSARTERHGGTYGLVLRDLDRSKDYNDALGHQAGDDALRHVATILDGETRAGDRVYRYGGEELLILLADQDAHAGATVAARHRDGIERAALPHPLNPPTGVLTFSAGVAAAHPGETPTEVLRRADEALYRAESSGLSTRSPPPPGRPTEQRPDATLGETREPPPSRPTQRQATRSAVRRTTPSIASAYCLSAVQMPMSTLSTSLAMKSRSIGALPASAPRYR
jgi:diguanylate cyclase (GGDEF)-like protein